MILSRSQQTWKQRMNALEPPASKELRKGRLKLERKRPMKTLKPLALMILSRSQQTWKQRMNALEPTASKELRNGRLKLERKGLLRTENAPRAGNLLGRKILRLSGRRLSPTKLARGTPPGRRTRLTRNKVVQFDHGCTRERSNVSFWTKFEKNHVRTGFIVLMDSVQGVWFTYKRQDTRYFLNHLTLVWCGYKCLLQFRQGTCQIFDRRRYSTGRQGLSEVSASNEIATEPFIFWWVLLVLPLCRKKEQAQVQQKLKCENWYLVRRVAFITPGNSNIFK